MSEFKTVRGMRDFLFEEARAMRFIEETARKVARLYGYEEVITPVVESYELLAAKAGEEVRSRMFKFKDLGDRDVALRPEFTASIARLVATTLRSEPRPFRLFSVGSIYRYDEPQRGRYREFWQSNYELMGSGRPEADAEIILLTNSLMTHAGLRNCTFKIGHVGVLKGIMTQEKLDEKVQNTVMQLMDKAEYEDALNMVREASASDGCLETLGKLVKLRGTKVFDIVEEMTETVKDYEMAVEAAENLRDILKLVTESGVKMDLRVDAGFARGLEYYTGMIFEVAVPQLDKALGGGGRYDKLIELYGGDSTPAVGVAHGIDRIMLAMQEQKVRPSIGAKNSVMVVPVNEQLKGEALKIARSLRDSGIPVEVEVMGRKMARALEDADRKKMEFAIIVGDRELKNGEVVIRDLKKREQRTVRIDRIAETVTGQAEPSHVGESCNKGSHCT